MSNETATATPAKKRNIPQMFNTFEEARAALGIPTELVTDLNRGVIESMVRKSAPAASGAKKELMKEAQELGVTFDSAQENAKSLKILVVLDLKAKSDALQAKGDEMTDEERDQYNDLNVKLNAKLEEYGWAFCDYNGKLYELKRKATPVDERNLPQANTAGYEAMKMVGLKEFWDMEFSDIAKYINENGKAADGTALKCNDRTVAFYSNFAGHRLADAAKLFGEEWSFLERPSVILSRYGSEVDLDDARKSRKQTGTEGGGAAE